MRESEALKILNIPTSTLKEWSKPIHPKHKLYLLIKHTDAKQALRTITQNVPAPILTLLNRNIKAQEHFHNDEIFKLFSKKSYAKLTPRERVAFAKLVRELDENTSLSQLFSHNITTPKAFLHLFHGSPFAKLTAFSSLASTLAKECLHG